ncbi:succinate dehydrogenase, cytochrome b556 subunit [Thioclava sp. GXIMD4216]|uniref:Succinate dehydrogenase cytochrome b556 subunit n=1 Tax=Thioclava litoralis TaxID=3076557 RepID=A0ABZ1DYA4_9RHOB|nr:succinate dehydrogenase, cytochrome b556 subunit [Thioclava sp. FTW29]
MAETKRVERPLSPFMIGQYYRPQMTSISSITVRITGIATFGFAVLIVLWLLTAATSAGAFAVMDGLLRSFIGDLLMICAVWALWYHMLGRLRHVIWDFGYALDIKSSETMGRGMFIGATVLMLFTIIVL